MLKFIMYFIVIQLVRGNVSLDQTEVIDRLEAYIQNLTDTMQGNTEKIHQIEQENARIKLEVGILRDEERNYQNEIFKLQHHVNYTTSILRGMVEQISTEQQQQISYVQSEVATLKTEQQQQISYVQSEVATLKSKMARTVFFSTYMTGSRDFHPRGNTIIPFNGVSVDSGGNYNRDTHKFRCPEDGHYFFTFSIHSGSIGGDKTYKYSSVQLVVDGNDRAEVQSWNSNTGGHTDLQLANSVISYCPAGGEVWLMSRYDGGQMWGSSTARRTTFSGFLMK